PRRSVAQPSGGAARARARAAHSSAALRALLGVRLRPSRLPRVRRKPRAASAALKVTRVGRASVQRSVDAGSWADQYADLGAELGGHHRFHHFSDSGTGGGTSDTDFGPGRGRARTGSAGGGAGTATTGGRGTWRTASSARRASRSTIAAACARLTCTQSCTMATL